MSNTQEIKNRIASVTDTKKITNAMYLISSIKMQKAKADLQEARPYFNILRDEIKRIFRSVKNLNSPYFYPEDMNDFINGKYAVLVITADKGLVGAYNENVIKEAMKIVEDHDDTTLYIVGEYGRQYCKKRGIDYDDSFKFSDQDPTLEEARIITSILLDLYKRKEVKKIFLVYTDTESSIESKPISTRLLPFHRDYFNDDKRIKEKKVKDEFLFYQKPEDVLEGIVESYINGYIYGALVDSYCSEQNSRMNAMSSANTNADKILGDLSIEYNRLRQTAITQQITEISAGAKAQKQKRLRGRK